MYIFSTRDLSFSVNYITRNAFVSYCIKQLYCKLIIVAPKINFKPHLKIFFFYQEQPPSNQRGYYIFNQLRWLHTIYKCLNERPWWIQKYFSILVLRNDQMYLIDFFERQILLVELDCYLLNITIETLVLNNGIYS